MNTELQKLYYDFNVNSEQELCKKIKLEIKRRQNNTNNFVKINIEFQNKKFTLNLSKYITGYDFIFILQTKIQELYKINVNAYDLCILNKNNNKPITHEIINKNNNEIFSLDLPTENYQEKIKKVLEKILKKTEKEEEKKEESEEKQSDDEDLLGDVISDMEDSELSQEVEEKDEFEEVIEKIDIFDVFQKNIKLNEKIFFSIEKINVIVYTRSDIKEYNELYLPLKSNEKVSDEKIKKYVEKYEEVEKKFIMKKPKMDYILYEFISKCSLYIKSDEISKNLDLVELLHLFDCNDIHPYISLNLEEPSIQKTKVTSALLENASLFQYWKNPKKNTILIKILHPQKFYYDFYIDEFSNILIDFSSNKNNLNIDIEDIYNLIEKDTKIILNKLKRYNVFKNNFKLKKENVEIKNIEKTFTLMMRNKYINVNEILEYLKCLHTHLTVKEMTKSFEDTITFNNHYLKDVDMKNKVYQLFWNKYYEKVSKEKVFEDFIYSRNNYVNYVLEKIPLNKSYVDFLYSIFEKNILKNENVFKNYQNTKLNPYLKFKSLVFSLKPYDKSNGIYLFTVSNYDNIHETKNKLIKTFIENFMNNYIDNESIIDCKLKKEIEQKKLGMNVNKNKKLKTYLKLDPKEVKYSKYCQKHRQPEIFYDDEEYETYLKNNNIENPEPLDFKGYKFLCPQEEHNKVGFLKLDTHPQEKNLSGNAKREICLPCCFKEEQKVNEFCLGNIDYEEYEKYQKDQEKGFYIYKGKFPLIENEVGDIPEILHNLLVDDKIVLRRRGLKDTSFFNAVVYCYFKMKMCELKNNEKIEYNDNEKLKQLKKIKNYLKNNERYFKSLHPFIYEMNRGDINRYIHGIKNNLLDPMYTIDMLSSISTLTDEQINIIVLKSYKTLKKYEDGRQQETTDIDIKCYQKKLLDTNKYIILYTEDDKHFEPLYQPYKGRKCSLYIHDFNGKNFNVLLRDWYSKNCRNIEEILTTNLQNKIKNYVNPLNQDIKSINKEIITNKNEIFTKNTYIEYIVDETEQRLLYELSYYIQEYPEYKELIKNATEKDQMKLAMMLSRIFNLNKVVYEKEVNVRSRKELEEIPNERKICSLNKTKEECNSNILCSYVDNKCKIRLDNRLKGVYFKKILDYIIRYRSIRDQIVNNTFDRIRNRFIFQSSNKNTYIN